MNLLQPQDRKAPEAGDARAVVAARAALEEAGVGGALVAAVGDRVRNLVREPGAVIVDLGCGTGRALGSIATAGEYAGVGVDLSVAAITCAARQWRDITWVVANADRRLPLVDGSVGVVISLHARRNPAEVARVLRPGGRLIVAVPGADDLIELRAEVQGAGVQRLRIGHLIAEHSPLFQVEDEFSVRERRRFVGDLLRQLLTTTYRGGRTSEARRSEALTSLEVTLASDGCVLKAG